LGNPAFERSGLTNVPAIDFALPLREQDSADLDERIYGPFESRLLVKAATAVGMAPEDALRGSHIKPDQLRDATTRVSARQRLAVYQNIYENCSDATVFLRAGNAATVCSFGIWGYALMSSSTYLDATHMAFKYLKPTGPLLEKSFDVEDKLAMFEARDRLILGPLLQPVIDFWFAFTVRISKEITQNAFISEYIEIANPRPAHADACEKLLGCPVVFGSNRSRICFNPEILGIELPRADTLSFQICDELCSTMLQEMKMATGPACEVRDLIVRTPSDFPSLSEVASRLYTTPRTLRRKLAEQGTSYQQILNDVRKSLAIKFLRETRLSMDEIAERVGFSDSRNFRQAFKKWTDTTPSSHRAH
jgi:AraC-like DNA-binding protein